MEEKYLAIKELKRLRSCWGDKKRMANNPFYGPSVDALKLLIKKALGYNLLADHHEIKYLKCTVAYKQIPGAEQNADSEIEFKCHSAFGWSLSFNEDILKNWHINKTHFNVTDYDFKYDEENNCLVFEENDCLIRIYPADGMK